MVSDIEKRIVVLGATGSVGSSTLDLVRRSGGKLGVNALTAGTRALELAALAKEFRPKLAAIADESRYLDLKEALAGTGIECAAGREALIEAAAMDADVVVAAIVGAAGLEPTLAAVRQGRVVAFANKECLVCAGTLFMREVHEHGAALLPVDSEHNAIFQVFDGRQRHAIRRIILTASGGPFRTRSLAEMARVTPEQAVAHPNWSMGAKISVDSATMMNKGLEVIEACHLFEMPSEQVDVLVHPQSVIHSMVEYRDGSVLAQLGTPDMRTPIAYALAWPDRMETPSERLDLVKMARLDFEAPDELRFPALKLARNALKADGTNPIILNASNEVAVGAFLRGRIGFLDIAAVVEEALSAGKGAEVEDIATVIAADKAARQHADEIISRMGR